MRKVFDGILTNNTSDNPVKIQANSQNHTISNLMTSAKNLDDTQTMSVNFFLGADGFDCSRSLGSLDDIVPYGELSSDSLLSSPYAEDVETGFIYIWTSVNVQVKLNLFVSPDDALEITSPVQS